MSFSGGMTLNGANSRFAATGGGTLNVTGINTIGATTAPTGPAAERRATPPSAAASVTFRSISANGGGNGIVLNNTGATAGLTVAGNGGACSSAATCTGGAIQNSTSHGVSLASTLSPSFTRLFIQNSAGQGVNGTDVTNFTFQSGRIDNSGTGLGPEASNIGFNTTAPATTNNLDGTVVITDNTLTNAFYHGIDIFNFDGTITSATISNNTITSPTSTVTSRGGGIRFIAFGSATTIANVTLANITNNVVSNFPVAGGFRHRAAMAILPAPRACSALPVI